jgi:hypothetical protein
LLRVHAAGRGSARHVRLSCGEEGVVEVEGWLVFALMEITLGWV